jgi:predicted helicase
LFDETTGYIRRDGVSDFILERAREQYGHSVTKETVFYYIYGFLHSPDYCRIYSADLRKVLPRVPLVEKPKDFFSFSKLGRELADLHSNYETVDLYPLSIRQRITFTFDLT